MDTTGDLDLMLAAGDLAIVRRALERALSTLHPLGEHVRRHPEKSRAGRHIQDVRLDIIEALNIVGADRETQTNAA